MANDLQIQVILKGLDQLSGPLGNATRNVDKLGESSKRAGALAAQMTSAGSRMALAGLAIGAGAVGAVKTFASLESAQVQLENAFTTKNGVSSYFQEISRQVVELGQKMPGSELDFAELAIGMKEAGADAEMMAKGGLKAAAALKVIAGLPGAETGRMFQEMANGMGIAGGDAEIFADRLARLKTSSGLTVPGLHDAFGYMAADLKQLGIQGRTNMELVLATAGSLKLYGGLQDSQVGSAMGQFLSKLAQVQTRIKAGDSRGAAMKAAFEGLDQAGIDMRFFDEGGNFYGLANAIGQVSKLNQASDQVRNLAGKTLFGREGGRVVSGASMENVNRMITRSRDQQTLSEKLARTLGTVSAKWDAVKGTGLDVIASAVKPSKTAIGELLDKINELLGGLQSWFKANPGLGKAIGVTTAALVGFLTTVGGGLWLTTKLMSAWTGLSALLPQLAVGLRGLMLANPWILALVAGGILLYTQWDKISPIMADAGTALGNVGKEISELLGDAAGLFGFTTKATEKFGLWGKAAWWLAQGLEAVATGLETVFALAKIERRLLAGGQSKESLQGHWNTLKVFQETFDNTKGSLWEKLKAANLAGGKNEAQVATPMDNLVRPLEPLAGRDPYGVGKIVAETDLLASLRPSTYARGFSAVPVPAFTPGAVPWWQRIVNPLGLVPSQTAPSATAPAATPGAVPSPSVAWNGARSQALAAGVPRQPSGQAVVNVSHAPTVVLNGSQITKEDVLAALRSSAEEVARIFKRGQELQERRAF